MGQGRLKSRRISEKIGIGKRVVHSDRTLGVYGMPAISLKNGEILEVIDTNKYGQATVLLQGKEFQILLTTISNCTNAIER